MLFKKKKCVCFVILAVLQLTALLFLLNRRCLGLESLEQKVSNMLESLIFFIVEEAASGAHTCPPNTAINTESHGL